MNEELAEGRIETAEIAIAAHKDAIARQVFVDDDPAQNLSQMLTSLETYAKKMDINSQATLEGDDAKYWKPEDTPAIPGR